MTNNDLISKLNNLKNVNPNAEWLKSNREILLSQISNSGGEKLSAWKIFVVNMQSFAKAASQPAFALGVFILLIGSALFSQQIFSKTKPNNSLYIARIISEKLKLNTTFNSQERDKLAMQFASERAKDISSVLADPAFNNPANQDQVAKLSDNFKQEVNTVKNSLSRLPLNTKKDETSTTSSDEVVIAGNSKDTAGIQMAETPSLKAATVNSTTSTASTTASTTATSTEINSTATSSVEVNSAPSAADKILDEATKLFNEKNYTQASDKLQEVDSIIKN